MRRVALLAVLGLLITSVTAELASGLPMFTALHEQKCNLCHVNPSGGKMRNTYGSQYFAQTEMAYKKIPLEEIERFQPQVSNSIWLGMDARTLYHYDDNTKQSTFFQMEGNLYVQVQLSERVSAALFKGLYQGFEVFGLGYFLPYSGYVKVGKFQPAYGWKFADHTSFVREYMLWPPVSEDTGIEIGFFPHRVSASVGIFNGTSIPLDTDKGKAGAIRVEFRERINRLGFGLGGSFYANDTPQGAVNMYGPLWYLKFGKLLQLGEVDWLENADGVTSFATTQDLAYMPLQGLWLKFKFDYFDQNVDQNSLAIRRYGVSAQFFPIGFVELEPFLRLYETINEGDGSDTYVVGDVQAHFFF